MHTSTTFGLDPRVQARRSKRVTALLVGAGVIMAACANPQPTTATLTATAPMASGSWPYPNGNLANTRDAPGAMISSANISGLAPAWTFELAGKSADGVDGFGSLATAPIVQDGVVYLQDLDANVYALALASGRLKWEYRLNEPERSGPGPNGVAVADGRVYGESPTSAFALDAATGRRIWVDTKLLGPGQGTFGIQPEVADGRVYLGSQYGSGPGGGVLLAVAATNGRVLWRFNTVIGAHRGVQSVGLGSGGAWETPLVSPDGSVTYGIGNPYQSAASAIAHPAGQLYTDSDVNLDATTGKLRWYYQGVTDDFKDYDMQTSPISASVNGTSVVIGAGKMGIVYEMSASTGRLLWKTPVGQHNGHDNDSLRAMEHESTLKAPYTYLPGSLGGILTNLALAGDTLYVATCNLAFRSTNLDQVIGSPASRATGDVEALDLATGKVEWDTKVPELPLGAATVSRNLLFTTLYNGVLLAFNRNTGAVVYRRQLPTSTNAPIAVAGNTILVPAGGAPTSATGGGGHPQLVAYTAPAGP